MENKPTYEALRKSINALIDYPLEEWRIFKPSADKCFQYLSRYEAEGRPAPKILIEDDGVTLTWETGEWKIYQHFLSDGSGDEFYCLWKKNG